jgi:hypothetical protein
MEKKTEYRIRKSNTWLDGEAKSLQIKKSTHERLAEYCKKNGFMMQHRADKIINDYLTSEKNG